ncbi:acyl carrier protein [Candidatus Poribacteria bacterium]|nr:acyl carrier protein [Candidatus Poribacteria bacterium]
MAAGNMSLEQIRGEVTSLISEIIEIPEEEIDGNASFVDDLDVDSLMALEIIANIEKKYRIQIPEENLQRVKTLNDTIALAQEYIGK